MVVDSDKRRWLCLLGTVLILGLMVMTSCTVFHGAGLYDLKTIWPVFLGHVLLGLGLFIASFSDMHTFMVRAKVFTLLFVLGLATHAGWSPPGSTAGRWSLSFQNSTAVSTAALGMTITAIFLAFRGEKAEDDASEWDEDCEEQVNYPILSQKTLRLSVIICGTYILSHVLFPWQTGLLPWIGILLLTFFFAFIIGRLGVRSKEVVEYIESGKPHVRRKMLGEFFYFGIILAVGICLWFLVEHVSGIRLVANNLLAWVAFPGTGWRPLNGLARSTVGLVAGGMLGWCTRIVFSLIFGKEAYGGADILFLAVLGAMSGWVAALLAFFLSCNFAFLLLAIGLIWKRKSSGRVFPLIPALTLAALAAIAFEKPILAWYGF